MDSASSQWKISFDQCFEAWQDSIKNRLPGNLEDITSSEGLKESLLPAQLVGLVDKCLENNRRFNHIINLLSHEIVSTALEAGICGGDLATEESLQDALNQSDKDAIGAIIGFKLYNRCMQHARKGGGDGGGASSSADMKATVTFPALLTPPPSNEPTPQTDIRVSKESSWLYAYNLVNAKDSEVNNATKVAKVFFDEVMTKDEVMNGSMRSQFIGEGGKRRKTEPFDPEKLNFIRDACAFVLNTSERKHMGTTHFEAARNNPNFKTLPSDVWQGLKMPVFSKHASLQRKKFEDEDQIKIVSVTSIRSECKNI